MIQLARPVLGEAEAEAVGRALASGWVTQGPGVAAFEQAFCEVTGATHASAVSNCTAALHLALLAVGVGLGDVVITVSHSFVATANAIRHCGAEPVFVDVQPGTLNLDPESLERCLQRDFLERDGKLWYQQVDRLKRCPESPLRRVDPPVGKLAAVMVVHQLGMPADLGQILPLAKRLGLPVVEDAACAIGSQILWNGQWEAVGKPHADVACFSFHPRKVITTGDGGMLTTKNLDHNRRFRLLRQHGMSISDAARHSSPKVIFEEYLETGYNYKLSDIQAVVGVEQLKRLPSILARRRELAVLYHHALEEHPGLIVPLEPAFARTNWQSYMIRVRDANLQRPVMQALLNKGINTRRGVMCAHLEAPYREAWEADSLPASVLAQRSGIILPLHPLMENRDVRSVAAALREIVGR